MSVDIHHLAVVSSDLQRSIPFYHTILGLHFIQKDPRMGGQRVCHFYWDQAVEAFLTFYHCPGLHHPAAGQHAFGAISFSVSRDAVDYWAQRFKQYGIVYQAIIDEQEDCKAFIFNDPDGLRLKLVFMYREAFVNPQKAAGDPGIRGIYGVEIGAASHNTLGALFTRQFHMWAEQRAATVYRFSNKRKGASVIDLYTSPSARRTTNSYGRIHHIAFRVHSWGHFVLLQDYFRQRNPRTVFNLHPNRFAALYFWEEDLLFEIVSRQPHGYPGALPGDACPFCYKSINP